MIHLTNEAKRNLKYWLESYMVFLKWFLPKLYDAFVITFITIYILHIMGGYQKLIEVQIIYYLGLLSLPKFALIIYYIFKSIYNSFEIKDI